MFSKENAKISPCAGFENFGTNAIIAKPRKPTTDKKWIFRAEFFSFFPQVNIRMCEYQVLGCLH